MSKDENGLGASLQKVFDALSKFGLLAFSVPSVIALLYTFIVYNNAFFILLVYLGEFLFYRKGNI